MKGLRFLSSAAPVGKDCPRIKLGRQLEPAERKMCHNEPLWQQGWERQQAECHCAGCAATEGAKESSGFFSLTMSPALSQQVPLPSAPTPGHRDSHLLGSQEEMACSSLPDNGVSHLPGSSFLHLQTKAARTALC